MSLSIDQVQMPYEIWMRVKWVVADLIQKDVDPPQEFVVSILWFAWFVGDQFVATPGESWRAIAVSSNLKEGVYFEVSYDHVSDSYIVDRYTRADRTVIENQEK